MPGCTIVNTEKDPDLGLHKFTFKFRDKAYTVIPKDTEGYERIGDYLKYVAGVCSRPGVNPFMYKTKGKGLKELFDIRPAGTGDKAQEEYDFSQIKRELEQKANEQEKPFSKPSDKKPLPVSVLHPAPPEGEQMSLFASDKNRISRVLLRYASWDLSR